MLKIVEATEQDALQLAPNLRAIDNLEVAAVGSTPLNSLLGSFDLPQSKVLSGIDFNTEEVIFMCGISPSPVIEGHGVIWMLASPSIHKYKRDILELTLPTIDKLSEPFEAVYNFVHKDNLTSIRWLEWAGFTVDKEKTYDQGGEAFYLLIKET